MAMYMGDSPLSLLHYMPREGQGIVSMTIANIPYSEGTQHLAMVGS
jgi:hypothetical protein